MPTATVRNPAADVTSARRPKKGATGQFTRTRIGGGGQVDATINVRYKKKRPSRGRKPARGRAALTIQLDSEKPMPKF